jgi:hypothetical protein
MGPLESALLRVILVQSTSDKGIVPQFLPVPFPPHRNCREGAVPWDMCTYIQRAVRGGAGRGGEEGGRGVPFEWRGREGWGRREGERGGRSRARVRASSLKVCVKRTVHV